MSHKLTKYNYLLWDFDGVIINSDEARIQGFVEVLKDYPQLQIDALIKFHKANGGLSRYVKFRYFFEEIRKEAVSEEKVLVLAESFSAIMRKILTQKSLLIQDSLEFIKTFATTIPMHIVSGSDGNELRFLCKKLGVDEYFITINGSPTPKIQLIMDLIKNASIIPMGSCLIGDAINDFDAAKKNGIDFYGYNNVQLKELGTGYIHTFSETYQST